MAIRPGLAKVAGAVRCNRWGSRLEGQSVGDRTIAFVPTLSTVLRNAQEFVEREAHALRLEHQARRRRA